MTAYKQVLTIDNRILLVQSNTRITESMVMYNFEIADYHTFDVSDNAVWVHNCGDKVDLLKPGPHAKESIPAHRGRPTAKEQREVNELMDKHGCHSCGTKDPGTKSGNAVADHQPPQALDEPEDFYPHCLTCARKQDGQVTQEKRRRKKL